MTLPERIGRRSLAATGLGVALFGVVASQASASYTAQVQGTTLQIIGNKDADKLVIAPGGTNELVLDVGADGTADFTFDRTLFTDVNVDAGAGDDDVRILNGLPDETFTVAGGSGDDTLIGAQGAEVFDGGSGDDFVDGNIGADEANLGTGNDTFQWDPGDGSDKVDGNTGNDTLAFNGSNAAEEMRVSPNGDRVRFTRNVASIVMDLDTIETISVRTLGSADAVTVDDLRGTGVGLVKVDGTSPGGGGDGQPDNVIVNGTDGDDHVSASSPEEGTAQINGLTPKVQMTGADSTLDTITVKGLAGADTITTNPSVNGPSAVVFDGGTEDDVARYDGTDANDGIGISRFNAAATVFSTTGSRLDVAAAENLDVFGHEGDDEIRGQNGIGAITNLTIDGGNGDDIVTGGDGADALLGGNGDDFVDGNIGADQANLGSGDDVFQWDPGDGSDVVDGKSGTDRMQFNGSNAAETINVFRDDSRTRLTRNVAGINMDFDTIEDVRVRALGSADQVTVGDMRGTGVGHVGVDLSGSLGGGDTAADTVKVEGSDKRDVVTATRSGDAVTVEGLAATTEITGSEPALDTLAINTLDGNDEATVAPDVADLIQTLVDLGADQ